MWCRPPILCPACLALVWDVKLCNYTETPKLFSFHFQVNSHSKRRLSFNCAGPKFDMNTFVFLLFFLGWASVLRSTIILFPPSYSWYPIFLPLNSLSSICQRRQWGFREDRLLLVLSDRCSFCKRSHILQTELTHFMCEDVIQSWLLLVFVSNLSSLISFTES